MKKFLFIICLSLTCNGIPGFARHLHPGFDKQEYLEMMRICAQIATEKIEKPHQYHLLYRSPVMGLDNRWDLWASNDSVAVLSIRGTTAAQESWLANFYAAMVPARGTLHLGAGETFPYDLAANPKAAVHIGWLVATGFLSKDMLPRIDSCYRQGIHDFIIMGHSQGGAISYLLTAYLLSLQKQARLPADIRFKTYCSAAPKPGNLYFAYDYEAMTRNQWSYTVVNSADWVPETPLSIQTTNDFNTTNPFTNAKSALRKQKFPTNLALLYAFNRMDNPSKRAARNYRKYLGKMASKLVRKYLPEYRPPAYYPAMDYTRAGTFVVLRADSIYYKRFPDNPKQIFVHHFFEPYIYLAERLPD